MKPIYDLVITIVFVIIIVKLLLKMVEQYYNLKAIKEKRKNHLYRNSTIRTNKETNELEGGTTEVITPF